MVKMKMLSLIKKFSFLPLLLLFIPLVSPVFAADIRGDDSVVITEEGETLDNPYLFGERVEVSVPVQNDLVAGAGTLEIESPVTGSILASGGEIIINSQVGNSIRVAGGDITISGQIEEDVVVMGGNIRITDEASISGDLIFFGGNVEVDGTVGGNVRANGGSVILNSTIGGDLQGNIGSLTLGQNAVINGDLSYTSGEEATIAEGAVVRGETNFNREQRGEHAEKGLAGVVTAGTIYTFIADILFVLLLLWLFRPFLTRVLNEIDSNYLKSAGLGFATLVLTPLIAIISLILLWLGLSIFFLYGLFIFLSLGIMKLFIGWKALRWWERRNNREYVLDWKGAIVGVLIVFLLGLIPVLGWLLAFILFLLALGGLTSELFSLLSSQQSQPANKLSRSKRK